MDGGGGLGRCMWWLEIRDLTYVGRYPREPLLRAGGGSDGGAGSRRFLGRNVGRCAAGHTLL